MLAAILADYDYDAIQTCAGDGSCGIACPVDINTGVLMKQFRHLEHGARAEAVAATIARQFGAVERIARFAVRGAGATARLLGHITLTAMTNGARAIVNKDLLPGWLPNRPAAARARLPKTQRAGAAGVYFTACVNRIVGKMPAHQHELSLQEAMIAVSARAGMPLWIPNDIAAAAARQYGTRRATRQATRLWPMARWKACGAGAKAVGCQLFATRVRARLGSHVKLSSICLRRIASIMRN